MSQGRIARLETLLGRVQANRGARAPEARAARGPSGAHAPSEARAGAHAPFEARTSDAPSEAHAPSPPTPPAVPPAEPRESSAASRRRLLTPLEQVIETASGARAPEEEAVTTPGTRAAPVGPPIDDLAPAAALLDQVRSEPAPRAEPRTAERTAKPLSPEPVRAASVAPPSAPIAAASGAQLTTGRATFGELLERALRLRPR